MKKKRERKTKKDKKKEEKTRKRNMVGDGECMRQARARRRFYAKEQTLTKYACIGPTTASK